MFEELTNYLKENLLPKVKEAFHEACKAFLETFWNYIKDEVILSARKSLKTIEALAQSPEGKTKKEAIADLIILKMNLPLILRPLKGQIRKLILKKMDEILHNIFGAGFKMLG
jgi:hypothetical protein